jgi:hypothetical protein
MTELERALVTLGRELEYPPTPELAPVVAERLSKAPPPRRGLSLSGRTAAIALAVFLIACGTVAAVPATRNAVLEALGLRGATIERRERLPADARPQPLDLGPRTTLAAARRELGFTPLVPAALGEPDGVHVDGEALTLDYRVRPRVLVTQFRGDVHPDYAGKIGSEATSLEELTVDGARAIWVSGSPHFFFYRDKDGAVRENSLRLAGNVLVLERDDLLVRVEGTPSKAEAIRIAQSLR